MFPISPEARPKMKMVRGQAALEPVSSSLDVLLSWRASRAPGAGAPMAMGDAAARAVRREMRTSFMVKKKKTKKKKKGVAREYGVWAIDWSEDLAVSECPCCGRGGWSC
jgi:hypothetical protein